MLPSFIPSTALPLSRPAPCRRLRTRPRSPRAPRVTSAAPPPRASANPSPSTSTPASSTAPPVTFTFLDNNSFTLSTPSATLLIDPWLCDDLVFLTPSFFRSRKGSAGLAAARAVDLSALDAVLLTQALPDHAHPPSLRLLPPFLPIIAPPAALPLLRDLGLRNAVPANHGDVLQPAPGLRLTVARGSTVGPPWSDPQLAFVFEFSTQDNSPKSRVYHEPHGNHDSAVLAAFRGRLDAVIAPVVGTSIPPLGNYALVNGIPEALQLCRETLPSTCLTFDNSGGEQSGFLTNYLRKDGGSDDFEKSVREVDELSEMRIITARPGEAVIIAGPGTGGR